MSRNRRAATHAERAQALDLAAKVGYAAAAEQTGWPAGTLRKWASRATQDVTSAAAVVGVTVVVPEGLPWTERRKIINARLGEVAHTALESAARALQLGDARSAREAAVAFGILVDKAQLLSGAATSRSEAAVAHVGLGSLSGRDLRAEIEQHRVELGLAPASTSDEEDDDE